MRQAVFDLAHRLRHEEKQRCDVLTKRRDHLCQSVIAICQDLDISWPASISLDLRTIQVAERAKAGYVELVTLRYELIRQITNIISDSEELLGQEKAARQLSLTTLNSTESSYHSSHSFDLGQARQALESSQRIAKSVRTEPELKPLMPLDRAVHAGCWVGPIVGLMVFLTNISTVHIGSRTTFSVLSLLPYFVVGVTGCLWLPALLFVIDSIRFATIKADRNAKSDSIITEATRDYDSSKSELEADHDRQMQIFNDKRGQLEIRLSSINQAYAEIEPVFSEARKLIEPASGSCSRSND